jgi:hypothetical protein
LLEDSRKFQNEVSERLAQQVLHALYELLRGFQAAHDASRGELLRQPLAEHPDEVYRALLTVILRLVFLLYAEERDMLPEDETFLRYYSLAGLFERLREDAALFPDTMDQRFGAWAQLLVLFRMIHDGADSGAIRVPKRHGVLFDPERFKFLEGRPVGGAHQANARIEPPLVPDGTIYRALEKLLVLDGERISYRALDVEQIGSVYETMMGFRLETTTGRSIAVKAQKKQGAPTAVDLEALLCEPAGARSKWVQERADRKLTDTVKRAVVEAATLEDLHAALLPVIDLAATPDLVPKGAMVLQPSEERRRSGSHYTPRALTEPIVRSVLGPILAPRRGVDGRLPRPTKILDFKVCDLAMGSGAFLVEACRQLGDALVEAWHVHGEIPTIPPDEEEVIFARRLVAQRCLYGLDKNPVAVDLAKMSLWLVTLAKDHALTFVDHSLRHGDSLVGLSCQQIDAFHWDVNKPRFQPGFETMRVREHVAKVEELRMRIRAADEYVSDQELRDLWNEVRFELAEVRLFADLVVAAFFEGKNAKEREEMRSDCANAVVNGEAYSNRDRLEEWRWAERSLAPFHWEIEFPEVFTRELPGFDAIVGNPPFMAKNTIATLGAAYREWLGLVPFTNGKSDIVAFFFRRAFDLLVRDGVLGLIATNTIAQGDTRAAGLAPICSRLGGNIFEARTRVRWPGSASVQVSIVHIAKGNLPKLPLLNRRPVERITAYLFHAGTSDDPARLKTNSDLSFQGCNISGQGFLFADDTDGATSIVVMKQLLSKSPSVGEVILPYLGGADVNSSPVIQSERFVIAFGRRDLEECRRKWPDLLSIVERLVKPDRETRPKNEQQAYLASKWWQWHTDRPTLQRAITHLDRVLVCSAVTARLGFAFVPKVTVCAHVLNVFALDSFASFAAMQSRPHEEWSLFFSSSLEDRLRYTPTDCFETYPFPENWNSQQALEEAGKTYYEFRATLMVRNNEGLTKIYNRLHDPDERDREILKLRELHAAMDRVVLDAYGWNDISTHCEFLLDYEIDEEQWGDKKKPYRFRWPDQVRDEVLARLLELNSERAKEDVRSGAAAVAKKGRKEKPARRVAKASETEDLFS